MDIKSLFPYEELSQGPLTQAGESQGLCWRHGETWEQGRRRVTWQVLPETSVLLWTPCR